MARNANGNYTLPNSPVVGNTAILAAWANTTMADLAVEVTDSLSRSGKGAMLAPLRLVAGVVTNPGLGFTADTATGLWLAGVADLRASVGGADKVRLTDASAAPAATFTSPQAAAGAQTDFLFTVTTAPTATRNLFQVSGGSIGLRFDKNGILSLSGVGRGVAADEANSTLSLYGKKDAADLSYDVVITSVVTRTAGSLLKVANNGDPMLVVGFGGAVSLFNSGSILAGTANLSLTLRGNKAAADTGADVILDSAVARTAGTLLLVRNNGVGRLYVGGNGDIGLMGTGLVHTLDAAANTGIELRGNKAAGDAGVDVTVNTGATRTAGFLFGVQNNGVNKLLVGRDGVIRCADIVLAGQGGGAVFITSEDQANSTLTLRGNRNAADGGTDTVVNSVATRTAGSLFDVQNNSSSKATIVWDGSLWFNGTAMVVANAADSALQLLGNRNAASSTVDVIVSSRATRTAGNLFEVQNNGTAVARVSLTEAVAKNLWHRAYKTADQSTTSSTFGNVTDLAFAVTASGEYEFECRLLLSRAAVATSVNIDFTGPAAPTDLAITVYEVGASGAVTALFQNAYSTSVLALAGNPGLTKCTVMVYGRLRNGANAGTVQLRFNSSDNATTTKVEQGSTLNWRRLDALE